MPNVWYLVVAGGGGGGESNDVNYNGGGGGAGGYRSNDAYDYPVTVGSYTVTVGNGGGETTAGQDSVFDTITATGGGKGGGGAAGGDGGSGGGGGGGTGANRNNGVGTASQGNDGGDGDTINAPAGGGGGASQAGAAGNRLTTGGKGGDGTSSTITGVSVTYAGGGGGAGNAVAPGNGGAGGGGKGGRNTGGLLPVAGTANTGGGGGGADVTQTGANGGSGVVIIRYLTEDMTATGGTITTDGNYTIHTFTSSGTFEVTALASTTDTHDGLSPEEQESVKREVAQKAEDYRQARARLKEQLRYAMEGPAPEDVVEELAEIALEQKSDSRLLAPHELVDIDQLMERLELRFKIEQLAAARRALDEDDADVELLLLH